MWQCGDECCLEAHVSLPLGSVWQRRAPKGTIVCVLRSLLITSLKLPLSPQAVHNLLRPPAHALLHPDEEPNRLPLLLRICEPEAAGCERVAGGERGVFAMLIVDCHAENLTDVVERLGLDVVNGGMWKLSGGTIPLLRGGA